VLKQFKVWAAEFGQSRLFRLRLKLLAASVLEWLLACVLFLYDRLLLFQGAFLSQHPVGIRRRFSRRNRKLPAGGAGSFDLIVIIGLHMIGLLAQRSFRRRNFIPHFLQYPSIRHRHRRFFASGPEENGAKWLCDQVRCVRPVRSDPHDHRCRNLRRAASDLGPDAEPDRKKQADHQYGIDPVPAFFPKHIHRHRPDAADHGKRGLPAVKRAYTVTMALLLLGGSSRLSKDSTSRNSYLS
jgi:hypothetical protein